MSSPASRHASGFTLFEVLAAALVLALVGTLLIGSMNTNLSHQSDARMRLEAGRLADSALADLEATLFDGSAPPLGEDERQEGAFVVRTKVAPFGALFDASQSGAGANAPGPGQAAPAGLGQAINGEFPGLAKHLRTLHVSVVWGSPTGGEKVERVSVAFDHVAALESFENLTSGNGEAS